MTTRPTDEDIRAMAEHMEQCFIAEHHRGKLQDKCASLLRAWLAERQAARDGVTDEMVERAIRAMWPAQAITKDDRYRMRAALESVAQPVRMLDREYLGRQVREVWIAWAREQPNPKPSWLVPWEELSEPDREVDCRIGEHIAMLSTSSRPQQAVPDGEWEGFQAAVGRWMDQCFIPSLYSNMVERGDRLLEEVLELLQSHGYDKSRVATLVEYVFNRPIGNPAQEVGGVMITLAGYCYIAGFDMHIEGNRELFRIMQPEVMAKIRAKQEAKNALQFDTPLPGNASAPAYNGKKEG